MNKVYVRQQLEGLGARPTMYGITREAIFVHAHVLLCCVGLDSTDTAVKLGKVGKKRGEPECAMSTELMAIQLVHDDPYAKALAKVALSLLPEGSGEYEMTQIVPSVHDDIP